MTEAVEVILSQVRDHYLDAYRVAIAEYKQGFSIAAPEVLLELDSEARLPYRYYRVDLASGSSDSPNFTDFSPDSHLQFETKSAHHAGMEISLSPLIWNGIEVEANPTPKSTERTEDWALRWIDPAESAESDRNGLGCYLHSITQPVTSDSRIRFSVDFGTATVDCVFELLDILSELEVRSVDLHSRSTLGTA